MFEDHYYAIELLAHARKEVEVALKIGGERYLGAFLADCGPFVRGGGSRRRGSLAMLDVS